jgi:hypothetical protein
MNRIALDELKQQVPLLEYLKTHDWQQARPIGFGRESGVAGRQGLRLGEYWG